jgi:hypothetical protein
LDGTPPPRRRRLNSQSGLVQGHHGASEGAAQAGAAGLLCRRERLVQGFEFSELRLPLVTGLREEAREQPNRDLLGQIEKTLSIKRNCPRICETSARCARRSNIDRSLQRGFSPLHAARKERKPTCIKTLAGERRHQLAQP